MCPVLVAGKRIGVCLSVDNCRLFVGGLPRSKSREEIFAELVSLTEGVKDVIVYPNVADKSRNRGFAFVEYLSHRAAAMARRKLIPGRIPVFGQQVAVDWAEPERDLDHLTMDSVSSPRPFPGCPLLYPPSPTWIRLVHSQSIQLLASE